MSRIGKALITLPKDVTVQTEGSTVSIRGAKGELSMTLPSGFTIREQDGVITVSEPKGLSDTALHGSIRAILANHIKGVCDGWTKILELSGVGYRATMSGDELTLTVGFSHPVSFSPPPGIRFEVVEGKIRVSGIDKQQVGQLAASIRAVKKPEPYKGKGIKYEGEHIRKKAGKAKVTAGSPGGKA